MSTGKVTIEQFSVKTDSPFVTLTTMIAPSPDWFVGMHGLSLLDDQGQSFQERQVELVPYDAGTDDRDVHFHTGINVWPSVRDPFSSIHWGR